MINGKFLQKAAGFRERQPMSISEVRKTHHFPDTIPRAFSTNTKMELTLEGAPLEKTEKVWVAKVQIYIINRKNMYFFRPKIDSFDPRIRIYCRDLK